ncbi:hypothetical protein [Paenibacillus sp. FSL H3-0286]|uniref:hypothetical protein n=1 Tax=Paenibacillus sp. FSL H3-0286 TaxID=2921427 RepID=UPI00324CE32E
MATNFEEVYDAFLSQINDAKFITIDEDNSLKYRYLLNSIARFPKCKIDLKKRSETGFDEDLTDQDILILSNLMVIEYLSPKIISLKNLEQTMSTKDFSMTSQAAHLKQLSDIKKDKQNEVSNLIIDYTYLNSDLRKLR